MLAVGLARVERADAADAQGLDDVALVLAHDPGRVAHPRRPVPGLDDPYGGVERPDPAGSDRERGPGRLGRVIDDDRHLVHLGERGLDGELVAAVQGRVLAQSQSASRRRQRGHRDSLARSCRLAPGAGQHIAGEIRLPARGAARCEREVPDRTVLAMPTTMRRTRDGRGLGPTFSVTGPIVRDFHTGWCAATPLAAWRGPIDQDLRTGLCAPSTATCSARPRAPETMALGVSDVDRRRKRYTLCNV